MSCYAVEEDGSFASMEKVLNPFMESLREASDRHYFVQGIPSNRVKGFSEVRLEDHGWSFLGVTRADKICCKDVVFSNIPTRDESSLVTMDEMWNEGFEERR